MVRNHLKIKTIINKMENDAISELTLEVFDGRKLFESNFSIVLNTAVLIDFRSFCKNSNECFEEIKLELKNKGFSFIRNNSICYKIEDFNLCF